MSDERGSDRPDQTSLEFPGAAPPAPVRPSVGVRLEVDEESIGWILFDYPGEKINKLTTPLMESLRDLLDEAQRKNVCALAFASDKPDMFIAGADVEEIAGVTNPKIGMEKATYGQAVFEAIARFPVPTAAVITGPCLGGGYELALACTWRVAENKESVRVGLPEIKLGIIPGFGGTQRLPRRVGLRAAMDVILAGKTLPAKLAFRRGMVDALVPPGLGRQVAREVLTGSRRLEQRSFGRTDRALGSVGLLRNFVAGKAREAVARNVRREHYPAPFMALESILGGYTLGEVGAYRNEARLLGEAIVTDTSKNLAWLFKESGRAKQPEGLDLSTARVVKRLAVVGAGVMGGGIAWLAGEKGYPIRIKDIQAAALESAMATAGTIWKKSVKKRRLTPLERGHRVEKLSFTLDYTGFGLVDVALEAVVENLEIKRKLVAELESVVREDAVIASNTSSLRIEDIAAGSRHPERIVGLHFFNPVDRMPLVEVIAGPQSAPWAVATAYRLALKLGKTPILVQDGPGFLVNRLLAFYLGEALALFESGTDQQRLDRALTDFGMPMGPITLLDQIGIDVADKVTHVMGEAFGDRLPRESTLGRLVEAGHLGRKTGQGFYVYPQGKKKKPEPSTEAARAAGSPARRELPDDDVLDRLVLPMINEAARCLEEGIAARPLDVDLGMVMGTGFPPFRGGLLRYADHRGVGAVIERLEELARSADTRFAPSEALRKRADGFYPR
jgi:3-hydroxyacyl-CoA dehydrogenase/enoyl-CoA hydratase/3-hydroxybutyryl-CoA epimerase